MDVLVYKDLSYSGLTKQYKKTVAFLKNGDFISADIKKLKNTGYYRAKLDYENRLLFKFGYNNGKYCILLLEVIKNHNYDKSRFLQGVKVDEDKLVPLKTEEEIPKENAVDLTYINPHSNKFHLLDKYISFDKIQEGIFSVQPPVVIVGSAGSGKTVLTLEKIKSLKGNILYVTLSSYLAENSAKLYYSNNYLNEKQEIDFLSYKEFLETLRIIPHRELDYKSFERWLHPRKQALGIKTPYKLFEEFRGVLSGMDITKEYLSRDDYLGLGVKQSIYLSGERNKVYDAFLKYLEFIEDNKFYDINIISFKWLNFCKPKYDFIIIDEVQDFTNIQLYIILKSLKVSESFILCGDANQIVHPNFFSWTHVKTMFYQHDISANEIKILRTNYRNSVQITELSNRLLKIKNARFGSIDKESTYLIKPVAENKGEVSFFRDTPKNRVLINNKTSRSARFAVLVMNSEDKADVKKTFKTPLVFSIHEAKGLEYENIIIINFISSNSSEFSEISKGITTEHLQDENFVFSRGKDKRDKSLDAYKFYINSLYVGITRAVKNLYFFEKSEKHDILRLLNLTKVNPVEIKQSVSSTDEWEQEVRKLEMQGKTEQAEEIRKTILNIQKPDWEPITSGNIGQLKKDALNPDIYNKKAKDKLFAYSILYDDTETLHKLAELKYRKAGFYDKDRNSVFRKYYAAYQADNTKVIEQNIKKYGVDYRDQFNLTPLLAASVNGSLAIIEMLIKYNANPGLTDNFGKNPLQIALLHAYTGKNFSLKLGQIYHGIVTEYVKIQVNGKMIKINNKKIEYLLLNFFVALQEIIISKKNADRAFTGITAPDIVRVFATWPENILPEYRKKRSYISACLSKNEMDSNNPWGKKIFARTERGFYLLNPDMELYVNEKWANVYEIMRVERIKILSGEERDKIKIKNLFENLFQQYKNSPYSLLQIKISNPDFYETMCKVIPEKMDKLKEEVEKLYIQEEQERKEMNETIKERKRLEHERKRKRQELKEKREREKRLKENDNDNQMEFPF
ncbi:MAG: hypothetical protein IEMM0006_2042 [bacterium]|nr:MAG: hypothetical protein IEMM0006_2042 [bacterium]